MKRANKMPTATVATHTHFLLATTTSYYFYLPLTARLYISSRCIYWRAYQNGLCICKVPKGDFILNCNLDLPLAIIDYARLQLNTFPGRLSRSRLQSREHRLEHLYRGHGLSPRVACPCVWANSKTNSIPCSARETPAQHSLIFCVNRGEIWLDTASNNLRRSALMARFLVARRFSTGIT